METGRIEKRVKFTDGTATVSAEVSYMGNRPLEQSEKAV